MGPCEAAWALSQSQIHVSMIKQKCPAFIGKGFQAHASTCRIPLQRALKSSSDESFRVSPFIAAAINEWCCFAIGQGCYNPASFRHVRTYPR